jgi:hypothetical protein
MEESLTPSMRIELEWLPPFHGPAEVARTSAAVEIRFGDENATQFEDAFSQSVQQRARVSAYPLAIWLASSWWRIRWEPLPARVRLTRNGAPADAGWRMSHELPAAGYGFIWPQLVFASDGESIRVRCHRSTVVSGEPARFLSDFETFIRADEFEVATDNFIDLVLRRLDALGETELHRIWQEVLAERSDPGSASARRLEARLGYEPDEIPPELLERFMGLVSEVGPDATDEIAPVCAGSHPMDVFNTVNELASLPGIEGRISFPGLSPGEPGRIPPWERGQRLAHTLRQSLGFPSQPVNDTALADLLHLRPEHLAPNGVPRAPMGLAVRRPGSGALKLLFRKQNRPARRFEAARFIADSLCAGEADRWLPVTDAATARQKVQRAFAAEFLCPIEALRDYLGDEFLPEAFEEAAEHFGISEMAIKSHLANHHLIPHSLVESETIP